MNYTGVPRAIKAYSFHEVENRKIDFLENIPNLNGMDETKQIFTSKSSTEGISIFIDKYFFKLALNTVQTKLREYSQ